MRRGLILPAIFFSVVSHDYAGAAPVEFDCDAPANEYSPLEEDFIAEAALSTVIETKRLRYGKFLPIAGAWIVSPDKNTSVRVLMIAQDSRARKFHATVDYRLGKKQAFKDLGLVSASSPIKLSVALTKEGLLQVNIANFMYGLQIEPFPTGKISVVCSTGHFKFGDLKFGKPVVQR